jgi:nucleoside-diphosphate-sugar epimerase
MRVIVTGGTGFIGAHVVAALVDAGHDVTVLARDPERMPRPLRDRVAMVRGELESVDARGHDVCIHNAVVWRDADDEIGLDDVRASAAVFRAAAAAGVEQLVYTSSTAVHRPFTRNMNETQRLAPTDYYGAAKAANEAFLAAVSWETTMRVTTIRPGPVVGGPAVVGAHMVTYRRLEEVVRRAREGADIEVVKNDGRQFIDARDLARLYTRVVGSTANRETYLAVAREVVTWEELARMAIRATGSRSRLVVRDAGLGHVPDAFDVGKIERDFGLSFRARDTIEADIRRLANA